MMDKTCLVCRKQSNGMHFGAITCRACAAFFRRATVLNLQYKCKTGKRVCNIDGRGRFVCRYCRLAKCHEIGMNAEKVQLDYDPTYSIRVLWDDSGSDEGSSPNGSPSSSEPSSSRKSSIDYKPNKIDPDLLFTFVPKPTDKDTMKIDFSDLAKKIETTFSIKIETGLSELGCLTTSLNEFRKNQLPKEQLKYLDVLTIPYVIDWLKLRIYKYACWFASSNTLMSLPFDQKFQLFKSSWSIIRTFERISMSVKIFENNDNSGSFFLFDETSAIDYEHSSIDFSSITELTNQYFNKLFIPYFHRYKEEVAKPILELALTPEEITFCMVHLIGFDQTDLTPETIDVCQNLKDDIANQMHHYYTNNTDIKMYSHRIIKLMNLVKSMKKIASEKAKIKELFWIFDVYHADISDPYFFEVY